MSTRVVMRRNSRDISSAANGDEEQMQIFVICRTRTIKRSAKNKICMQINGVEPHRWPVTAFQRLQLPVGGRGEGQGGDRGLPRPARHAADISACAERSCTTGQQPLDCIPSLDSPRPRLSTFLSARVQPLAVYSYPCVDWLNRSMDQRV